MDIPLHGSSGKPAEKLQERMATILDETCGIFGYSMKKFFGERKLPIKILENLEKFFNLLDQSLKLHINLIKKEKGLKVYCHPGCFWCCFQMPEGIHIIEYIYLYHGICKIHPRNLYLARLFDRCEVFTNTGNSISLSQDSKLYAYFRKKQGCPFLNKATKNCEIYLYRPIICRSHFSFSPPRFCHPDQKELWRRHIVNIEPSPMVKERLIKLDRTVPFRLSQFLIPGITDFIVNIMKCRPIIWI